MVKKDYNLLTDWIRDWTVEGEQLTSLIEILKEGNPNFNEDKFYEAVERDV